MKSQHMKRSNSMSVYAWDTEQYIDCRGVLSIQRHTQGGFVAASFTSDQGWAGELFLGYEPSGVSFGDNQNMRLQGLLGHNENMIHYPLISSWKLPETREGDVGVRSIHPIPSLFDPLTHTYGLGVAECWNRDRPAFSKIVSLTNIINPITDHVLSLNHLPAIGDLDYSAPNSPSAPPTPDSETAQCIAVHVRPSVLDYAVTGTFASYVCTDCGVVRRIDGGNYYQDNRNDRISDSHYALIF